MAERRKDRLSRTPLGPLLKRHPRLLRVLDKHGVTFCSGCYLTLTSPLERAAAYHAVLDLEGFLKDVARALKRS